MNHLQRIDQSAAPTEISCPDPATLILGNPIHTTWNIENMDGLYCGLWQSTPGKWQVAYSEWEYIFIHSGHSILTDEKGTATHLRMGDRFIIRPGFVGTWEVLETTLKDYVIKT